MKQLNSKFYAKKRQQVAEAMAQDSVLILAGNSELERTRDVPYDFRQSNNFLYLTGVSQPDAVLIITKTQDGNVSETLYITELHPFMEIWEGRSNKVSELQQVSGIHDVQEYKQYEELLGDLVKAKPGVAYLDMPDNNAAQVAAWEVWQQIKDIDPDLELAAINGTITDLRVIKEPEEVELIKAAIEQTDAALQQVYPMLIQGLSEREVAAEFVRFCSVRGLEQAWPPIVSFGKNACTIHHTPDDTKLKDGNLVLFDVGVEVGGYAADISRMVPVGTISDRQQQVLDAVADVQAQAIELMKPGIKFSEFEKQVGQIMAQKLVDIGMYKSLEEANKLDEELQWPAYRRYFSHSTSHYLGLDAHDVGPRDIELRPGMVLTCEPGIYIAEEGIGVRIEDDILITATGNINLTKNVVAGT